MSFISKQLIFSAICIFLFCQSDLYSSTREVKQLQYLVEHKKLNEELPFSVVLDTQISKEGYLWVTNYDGLFRYDGEAFIRFGKKENEIFKSGALSLVEDAKGALWISGNGGGITRFFKGHFQNWKKKDGLEFLIYHQLYLDHEKNLVVLSKSGIQRIRENKIESFPIPGIHEMVIRNLCFAKNGNCYLVTSDSKLFNVKNIFNQQKVTIEEINLTLRNEVISCIGSDDKSSLWVGTSIGKILKVSPSNHVEIQPDGVLNRSNILDIKFDHEGRLWIVQLSGIWAREHDQFKSLKLPIGTNEVMFSELNFTHDNGIVVAGRNSGLFFIRTPNLGFLTKYDGLMGEYAFGIFKDKNNRLWIPTDNGLQTLYKDQFKVYREDLFSGKTIRDVFIDSKERLWASELTTHIYSIDLKSGNYQRYGSKFKASRFRTIAEDHNGRIWVGTNNGVFSLDQQEPFPHSYQKHYLKNRIILSLFVDPRNRIWTGTANDGLYRIEDENIQQIQTDANTVFSGFLCESKKLLFGSTNGVIMIDENDRVQHIHLDEDEETIFNCIEDKNGNFWFVCIHSIKKVNKQDIQNYVAGKIDHLPYERFDQSNALPAKDPKANARCTIDEHGKIWIPLKGGISIIDPENISKNNIPPRTNILSLELDDNEVIHTFTNPTKSYKIQPSIRTIRIRYAGISYQTKGRLKYKIRLNGYETWKETNRIEATYSNLQPGDYQFEVFSRNSDGIWNSEPESITLHILPSFYQTHLFQLSCVIFAVLLIYTIYRSRIRFLKNQQKKLENLVRQRTQQLEEVSSDLFDSVSALTDANEKKRRILSMAAHDLKNAAGGIVYASELIEGQKDDTSIEKAENMMKLIKDSGNQIMTTIQEILEKEADESNNRGLKLEHRSLLKLVESVIALNKIKSEAKRQSCSLRYDTEGLCTIDQLKMRMAIDNYLSNAIKYSPFGSQIFIKLEKVSKETQIFIKLSVQDDGPGLTEDDKSKVFGRFMKLSATPTGKEHSSGLGLSIVKEIVQAHSGEVGVTSTLGKGSCFYFLIPIDLKPIKDENVYANATPSKINTTP